TVTSNSGAMTVAYAAPEFFNGQTSDRSDQYSLAVTYCQLRGGRLPFEGTQQQVMIGHIMQPPDLAMLPEAERPAVARALAKKPAERGPPCRASAEAPTPPGASGPPSEKPPPADAARLAEPFPSTLLQKAPPSAPQRRRVGPVLVAAVLAVMI